MKFPADEFKGKNMKEYVSLHFREKDETANFNQLNDKSLEQHEHWVGTFCAEVLISKLFCSRNDTPKRREYKTTRELFHNIINGINWKLNFGILCDARASLNFHYEVSTFYLAYHLICNETTVKSKALTRHKACNLYRALQRFRLKFHRVISVSAFCFLLNKALFATERWIKTFACRRASNSLKRWLHYANPMIPRWE